MAAAFLRMSLSALCFALIASQASAQSQSPIGGFQHDSSQPIEISADSFEVRQQEQVAVFVGSVRAKQGDVRMQAQRLTVTYDPDGGGDSAIRQVRAEGDVLIQSVEETAQGNWADYDVASGRITMGDDVALTQGAENIVVGGRLEIDLNTGFAKMQGAVAGTNATPGRVEMILTPSTRN